MAIENGADEVDIVLNVGRMLTGEYDEAANEVEEVIRAETDPEVVLESDYRVGSAQKPRTDPQGIAAVDVRGRRLRENLDGQDRRSGHAPRRPW